MCRPASYHASSSKLQNALNPFSHPTTASPATEALNQQLIHDISKRRKLGDASDRSPCDHLSLTDLNMSLHSSFFSEQRPEFMSFPPINSLSMDDYESDESAKDDTIDCMQHSHLGKRCRGVVRSQTIPSSMCLMDKQSLATTT